VKSAKGREKVFLGSLAVAAAAAAGSACVRL